MKFYVSPEAGQDVALEEIPQCILELRKDYPFPNPIEVIFRDGVYRLKNSLRFNRPEMGEVTLRAEHEGKAVLSGGRTLTGWTETTEAGRRVWTLQIPEVAEQSWYFRQLFVNGVRRPRARFPKFDAVGKQFATQRIEAMHTAGREVPAVGLHEGDHRFRIPPGPAEKSVCLRDAEAVLLHFWIDERLPDLYRNPSTGWLESSCKSVFNLREAFNEKLSRFYIDNLAEALTDPGEWYLDRATGVLRYLPLAGETLENTALEAPVPLQFMVFSGKPHQGEYIEHVRIQGLRFECADWCRSLAQKARHDQPDIAERPFTSSCQNTTHLKGSLSFSGCRHVRIESCAISKTGLTGIGIESACENVVVSRCEIRDTGAAGVKITGGDAYEADWTETHSVTVEDCEIHEGGRVFSGAPGIVIQHASHNRILHNHISDFFYTGIACGSVWSYEKTRTNENRIEGNHIHHLGQGLLNDMGGIYLLGIQQGTFIRNNWVHDITAEDYGANGIYLDEACSHAVVEGNAVHHVQGVNMLLHRGRENIIRNNLFAFGGHAVIQQSNVDQYSGFTCIRNIVVSDGSSPVVIGGYACDIFKTRSVFEANLYWGGAPDKAVIGNVRFDENPHYVGVGFNEWTTHGNDLCSLETDPQIVGLGTSAVNPAPGSPAWAIGFKPLTLDTAGPRPDAVQADEETFVSTTEMKFG